MRKLVVTENISLDGRIEMLGKWFRPDDQDPGMIDALRQDSAEQDDLILGRVTFEAFRSFWPLQTDDTTGITAHLNGVTKHVVSSTLTEPGWENSRVLPSDWISAVRHLRNGEGGDIGVTGSIRVVHALIEADLVDEYNLFVFPIVQGRGRRLFPSGFEATDLSLVEEKRFDRGIVQLRYRREK